MAVRIFRLIAMVKENLKTNKNKQQQNNNNNNNNPETIVPEAIFTDDGSDIEESVSVGGSFPEDQRHISMTRAPRSPLLRLTI